jgi:DinB family protein
MRYRVGVADFGQSFVAFAFDLPGCSTNASSRDLLIEVLPVVVADYVAWLRHNSVAPTDDWRVDIDVVEDVRAEDEPAVEGEFCFADDLRPVTTEEIEIGVRMMERSREDLLEAIRGLPDAVLDWRPPLSAMAQVDDWKPQVRTIREIVDDVAASEFYYRSGLCDGTDRDRTGGRPAGYGDAARAAERRASRAQR